MIMVQLTEKDKVEIGRLKNGFPWMNIEAPATTGRGIVAFSEAKAEEMVEKAEAYISGKCRDAQGRQLSFAKFVPASGAASRMFKDLFSKNPAVVDKFASNIEKFAFYNADAYSGLDKEACVDYTLGAEGLGYGSKPKAVLKFHGYGTETRTAIAEHLVEAAHYMKDANGVANLIVTISPEHQELFDAAIAEVKEKYEKKYGVKYNIKTVFQHKWTDTVAVTPEGEPFVTDDGSVLHRPGGHGALIHNLNEVDADVVSIKNIDNVSVERFLPVTAKWKKVLIGTALSLKEKIESYIEILGEDSFALHLVEIESFFKEDLCVEMPTGYDKLDNSGKKDVLAGLLGRPIRVCGMVRNEGEPGGGPFVIREKDGSTSLQILEGVQIDRSNQKAVECLEKSTHFNPVDLVCVLTDGNGRHYNLLDYVDNDAGFISSKSYQGRELKALELPGLWNGAMSRWNTVFVEVPTETFNPVKTVMDLLRPAHQAL